DYDLRGFYKAGYNFDDRGHGPDRFKKPNHPTFSDESMYHDNRNNRGGHWSQDAQGRDVFEPNTTNYEVYSPQALQNYFQQYEPGATLKHTDMLQPKILLEPIEPDQGIAQYPQTSRYR